MFMYLIKNINTYLTLKDVLCQNQSKYITNSAPAEFWMDNQASTVNFGGSNPNL